MKAVGLTGGIGSGKTTVASLFERFGYAVYYADPRAKALYHEDAEVQAGAAALPNATYWELDSVHGHDAFLMDAGGLPGRVGAFLRGEAAQTASEWKGAENA